MASIHKRNDRWQVQVRSRIYGSISKSFHRKSDAQKWAIIILSIQFNAGPVRERALYLSAMDSLMSNAPVIKRQ